MNWIDLAVLGLLALAWILGYYQGLVKSALAAAGALLAMLAAALFYPALAHSLGSNAGIISKLIYYAEGSEMIGGIRIASLPAAKIPEDVLERIVAGDWVLPHVPLNSHLGRVLTENVTQDVFAAGGAVSLGDYLCNTIAQMTVNLVSYVLVFVLVFAIAMFVVYMCDNVFQYPVLRMGDGILGGFAGLGMGALVLTVLFLLLPVVLSYLPVNFIREMVEGSRFCKVFLDKNLLLPLLPGYIG